MRSVTLEDGRRLRVGVKHDKFVGEGQPRATSVRVSDESGSFDVTGVAVCGKRDNFCKLEGRRLAAMRALDSLPVNVSKEGRRLVFLEVCPEFETHSVKSRKAREA